MRRRAALEAAKPDAVADQDVVARRMQAAEETRPGGVIGVRRQRGAGVIDSRLGPAVVAGEAACMLPRQGRGGGHRLPLAWFFKLRAGRSVAGRADLESEEHGLGA